MSNTADIPRTLTYKYLLSEAIVNLRLVGRRSLLALIGIGVGCGSVVALLNIGYNAAAEATNAFEGLGTDTLVATFSDEESDTRASLIIDPKQLRIAVPGVSHSAPISVLSTRVLQESHSSDAVVIGSTSELIKVLNWNIAAGRWLSTFDSHATYVVLGSRLAQSLDAKLGSRLQIQTYFFEVIGVLDPAPANPIASIAPDDSAFLPVEGMRRLVSIPQLSSVVVKVVNTKEMDRTAGLLKRYLAGALQREKVEVQVPKQLLDALTRQARTFSYLLAGLGLISLLVGGVGVMNVMLMSVDERRREIGLRMALGARRRDIRGMFLIEAAVLSVAGATGGTAVGLACAYAFVMTSGWSFKLAALSIPLAFISSTLIGVFFGLHPAVKASRMKPVDALRDD